MNLSELNNVEITPDHPLPPVSGDAALANVVARLSAEVAGPLTQALNRVISLAHSGSIDRQGLQSLRREIDGARRAGLLSQQIARFANGQAHPGIERVMVGDVLRAVLTEQVGGAHPGALGHRQSLAAACVMGDVSLIHTLLQATAAWALDNARTTIEWTLETEPWPPQARLTCRFGLGTPDAATVATARTSRDLDQLDSLDWLLLGYAAHLSGVTVNRAMHDDRCLVTLRFRHVVDESVQSVTAVDMETSSASRAVLTGCQVLVLAARRDARQRVREALRGHEVFIDYAPTVTAAEDYCDDGSPQVLIYESGFEGEPLRGLKARLAKLTPAVVVVEVSPTGLGCEIGPGGMQLGGEGLNQSLAAALLLELSRRA